MHKNFKYVALIMLPLLTIMVWLIWVFLIPAFKKDFLERAGRFVDKTILTEKKRRTKGFRLHEQKTRWH